MCGSDTKEKFGLGFHYADKMMLVTVCAVLSVVPEGARVVGKLHVRHVKLFFWGGMAKRKTRGEIGFCGRETLQTLPTLPRVELCDPRLV